ncbi:MAG: glycosyltransferase [Sedimentisphaerales bacterium]|nr:glycosyltransferase [Sedimentisphaerales bacterium]
MTHGGIETFLMSLLRGYDRRRFHMDILYIGRDPGDYAPEVERLGARLIHCPFGYDQVRFVYRFTRFLRRQRYDAVNGHLADMSGGALLAARLAGVPARVASYHCTRWDMGWLKNLYLWIMRRVVLKTATSITTSAPSITESFFPGEPPAEPPIHPIAYGVDTEFFGRGDVAPLDRSRFGFGPEHLIVGHVGRFVPQKNHAGLIRIAAELVRKVPQARFVLCGAGGTLKDEVARQVSQLGLSDHVAWVHGLEDMRRLYYGLDVFCLPSHFEGMPISLIEAQACGRPVVASRLGGIVPATAPAMRANLFDVEDVPSFVACLADLLADKAKRLAQGQAGQRFVRDHLDVKLAIRQYEKLYLPGS